MNECLLHECKNGTACIVSRVEDCCHHSSRLQEMGLIPGQWVEVLQSGSLYKLAVGDSRICLRKEQLNGISVCPVSVPQMAS